MKRNFSTKRLKEFLLSFRYISIKEQKVLLEKSFEEMEGKLWQN